MNREDIEKYSALIDEIIENYDEDNEGATEKALFRMIQTEQINVLMSDGCTFEEAADYIEAGAVVFLGVDFENHLENYMAEWELEEDHRAELREMVRTGKAAKGWGVVNEDGEKYYIMY